MAWEVGLGGNRHLCFLIRAHFIAVEQLQQILTCLTMHMGLRASEDFFSSGGGSKWLPGNAAMAFEGGPLAVLKWQNTPEQGLMAAEILYRDCGT